MESLRHLYKMDNEVLNWIGNALNFLILVYLIRTNIILGSFNFEQSLIATFGLFVAVLIQLYNIKK
ncbi:hypothetical protein HOC29_04350 [archaeon]|jgi:hypothetical protein|nr:hypothetical protein [archaeon]